MDSVERSMMVGAPEQIARASWQTFIDDIRAARERLACDQLVCVDAAAAGLVTFDPAGDDTTLVTFRIPIDAALPTDGDELSAAVDDRLRQDLVKFKDYLEGGATAAASGRFGHAGPWTSGKAAAGSARPADPARQA